MRILAVALALSSMLASAGSASAVTWSFCIAPADGQNRIYISSPFQSVDERAERQFDEALWSRQLTHDSVQCPLADNEPSAIIMHQHAIDVNREWRRKIIELNWRPAQ